MCAKTKPDPSESADWLGIHPTTRVWVGGRSRAARPLIERLVGEALRPTSGPIDVAILLPTSLDEVGYFAAKLRLRMEAGGRLWVVHGRPTAQAAGGDPPALRCTPEQVATAVEPLGYVFREAAVVVAHGFVAAGFGI